MNTSRFDDDVALAKKIEAGLFAQEAIDAEACDCPATREELAVLVAEGERAKERLVLNNLGLVAVIASEIARMRRIAYDDLYQEGCLALQEAVMRYDWRKGPFGPYAGMWIRSVVRSVYPRHRIYSDKVDQEDLDVADHLGQVHDTYGMAQILALIPSDIGEVVKMRHGWDGHTHTRAEVASALNMSLRKVKTLETQGVEFVRSQWELAQAA